jgi:ParB family transcriptional regulator, chromosome partitioning protein
VPRKLQPAQQEEALRACYQEQYSVGNGKAKRILLPVRHLQQWIEHNILLELAAAPFSKEDAALVPDAGSCVDCPKRTGHNKLLFGDDFGKHGDRCSDPKCWAMKVDAHVKQAIAAKPKLVQISTAYGAAKGDSPVVPRNKYVEIRPLPNSAKPANQKQRDWPEYKTCKFTTEAIVTEGSEKGEKKRVCANPDCPIHHARKQRPTNDAAFKSEQEKRRREEAIAQTTGLRVLKAIGDAVPIRLMKRDLLFTTERLVAALDERRIAILLRIHGVGKANGTADAPAKLFASFLRKADEGTLDRVLVEVAVLQSAHSPAESAKTLHEAAEFYKVDVAAIASKIKQEFAAKEKARETKKATPKPAPKRTQKATAA